MSKAPDRIHVACPKCRKQISAYLDELWLKHFKCPFCDFVVTADSETLNLVKKAHDQWTADLNRKS